MRAVLKFGSASTLVLLAACAAPMQVPEGFSRLRGGDGFVARAADDGVLRSRKVPDPTEGSNAAFWLQALRTDFVGQRGYVETGTGEVADADGVTGHWIECTANVRGEKVGYLAAVWARPAGAVLFGKGQSQVQVVEFAAREPVYSARIEAVKKSLSTVRD
jgi:hypothetical protein